MSRVCGANAIASVMTCVACTLLVSVNATAAVQESNVEQLRDPTTPLTMNAAQATPVNLLSLLADYKLSSILIRPNMKVAVINSRQVREGEMIGSAEVVNIDRNSVTLMIAGDTQVLELYGRSIRSVNTGDE